MYTHPCIKCGTSYTDSDPDAYYCPPCNEERKKIAEQVDKQMAGRPKRPRMSELQAFDADPNKIRGFQRVTLS